MSSDRHFEIDFLEPLVGQREEDAKLVAIPLNQAGEALHALTDQALGVAEPRDDPREVVGKLLGRGVAVLGRLARHFATIAMTALGTSGSFAWRSGTGARAVELDQLGEPVG